MTASRIDSAAVRAAGFPAGNQRMDRASLVVDRGWVHEVLPDRSGFVLRNSSGLHKVDCRAASHDVTAGLRELRPEYVVTVEGHREEEEDGGAGGARLKCTRITVISESQGMPFTAATRRHASPALRAKYRYLEFRDPEMLAVLRARHTVVRTWCQYLDDHGFLQVETPLLAHASGSGAHEFGVVSQRGDNVRYALAQSAQVYGQLVMAGGIER
ncbi:MAG: amino acid--tRNA ligase-related protein, partial [Pseudonocardiaceae bacterium]